MVKYQMFLLDNNIP